MLGDLADAHAWYALRTRSRHEKVVRDQLATRGIEPFLPLVTRWRRWKDRRKQVAFPLFPGYCFARFPLRERLAVLTAHGVVQILGNHDGPIPVPEAEIEGVRRLGGTGCGCRYVDPLRADPAFFLAWVPQFPNFRS